jgi:diguanylate cyclase (GGDEF)-like protein
VRRRLDYENVSLLLVDQEGAGLVLAAHSGDAPGVRPDHRQALGSGVLGEVVRTGRPRNVPNVAVEPRYLSDVAEPRGSELAVPLVVDGQVIGAINVESDRTAAFTSGDEAVLTAVAGQLAPTILVAQLHDATKRAADTDGLTGLANHRAFYEALRAAADAEDPLSVVVMDVEGLKRVNNTAGHLAGDALLRRVADAVVRSVRVEDLVARYGGDEFVVIMRGVDGEEATQVAARIRRRLQRDRTKSAVRGTVRYGVATLPEDGTRAIDLVAVADRRLYAMRDRSRKGRRRSAAEDAWGSLR